MNVTALSPSPEGREPFRRNQANFVPDKPGCYVLTSFDGTIIYVGLATKLRSRMIQHLETPEKVALTNVGRAAFFHWLEATELEQLERSWMNAHQMAEGALPILNKAYSPVRT